LREFLRGLLVRRARGIETIGAIELPGAQNERPVVGGEHVLRGVASQNSG
jgi:hypothetical protein